MLTVLILGGLAAMVVSFVTFDRLLRTRHRENRAEWSREGRAIGFLWVPLDGDILGGSLHRVRLYFSWLRSDPTWWTDRPDMLQTAVVFRGATAACLLFWIALVILAYLRLA